MSHINYAFNPEDDALPRDKMKLRNIASTKYLVRLILGEARQ